MSRRLLVALLVLSLALNVAAIAWVSWIAVDPQYWFPGAYAEKGAPGDRGRRGPVGPPGPPGPVGPDAEDAFITLDGQLADLSSEVDDLRSEVDDLRSGLDGFCAAVNSAYLGANSATEEMLFELDLACP